MPVQAVAHFGICVADPVKSMHFYSEVLGFDPLTKLVVTSDSSAQLVGLPGLELHSYFMERDGVRIELLHYVAPGFEQGNPPRPMNRRGLTHLALRVDRIGELLERIEAAGGKILTESRIQNPEFGSDVVFVLDPDGVRIELIEMPGDLKTPLGDPL